MHSRLLARFAFRESMGVAMMAAALFVSAGGWRWWQGWAAVALTAAWAAATGLVVWRRHPGLLAERLGPRPGAKGWDVAVAGVAGILQLAVLVVAGLDRRWGWSGQIGTATQVGALVVAAVGYAIVVWATACNAFFSQVMRIQTDRGHAVASGGPYRFVRHPAYAGTLLTSLAVPLLLGSWWALLSGGASAVLVVVRTALEDRALQDELPGYRAYAGHVRRRLLPGLW